MVHGVFIVRVLTFAAAHLFCWDGLVGWGTVLWQCVCVCVCSVCVCLSKSWKDAWFSDGGEGGVPRSVMSAV